jgi:hypothetical protein
MNRNSFFYVLSAINALLVIWLALGFLGISILGGFTDLLPFLLLPFSITLWAINIISISWKGKSGVGSVGIIFGIVILCGGVFLVWGLLTVNLHGAL